MSLNIPPQKTFLYKENWSYALDESLLETINRLKEEHNVVGTVIPKPFFHIAAADIAYDLGVDMPWDALYDRLQFLESRYLCFSALVKENGIVWDVPNNIVDATDETWNTIFEKNKLAGAYYYNGEPSINQLSIMFGPKDLKQEQDNEVIVLSDTTVPVVATVPILSDGQADTDETVVSPLWTKEPKSRRKLFDEDQTNGEGEASNEANKYYYTNSPNGYLDKFKPPPPPREVRRLPLMPNSSPTGSSCASSSPIGWLRKMKK